MTTWALATVGRGRGGRPALRDAGLVALCAATPALLRRLRADLLGRGDLRMRTATAMGVAYAGYAALVAEALARPPVRPRLPGPARAGALGLTAAGAGLVVAGTGRFSSLAQLSGTASGSMVRGGVYRFSRNPQYLGAVLALAAVSGLRRSPGVLALSAALAGVYRWWVPVEEQHLAARFGEPYQTCLQRTARWLGPAGPCGEAR